MRGFIDDCPYCGALIPEQAHQCPYCSPNCQRGKKPLSSYRSTYNGRGCGYVQPDDSIYLDALLD